jgi:lysophospholipase L1-like esterase
MLIGLIFREGTGVAQTVGPADPDQPAGDSFKILVIGDSISAGVVGLPKGPPYTEILLERLQTEVDPKIHMENVACSGSTSKDWTVSEGKDRCLWLMTTPTLYENRARPRLPADLVILMLGGNDAATWTKPAPFTAEEYRTYMTEVIEHLKEDGARKTIWMTSPRLGVDSCSHAGVEYRIPNQLLAEYREVALDVCSKDPLVECGPDLYRLFPYTMYHGAFCDPHPNKSGSMHIANYLFDSVEKLYRRLRAASTTPPRAGREPLRPDTP